MLNSCPLFERLCKAFLFVCELAQNKTTWASPLCLWQFQMFPFEPVIRLRANFGFQNTHP